uniref:Uncharacterized protein n=1 Tax=Palpitomonas bilix TaxID=652834 RepID=A0A7S3D3M7_9EUKA
MEQDYRCYFRPESERGGIIFKGTLFRDSEEWEGSYLLCKIWQVERLFQSVETGRCYASRLRQRLSRPKQLHSEKRSCTFLRGLLAFGCSEKGANTVERRGSLRAKMVVAVHASASLNELLATF